MPLLVVEWLQLSFFPAKMSLFHARALLRIEENAVLLVFLVLKSKGIY